MGFMPKGLFCCLLVFRLWLLLLGVRPKGNRSLVDHLRAVFTPYSGRLRRGPRVNHLGQHGKPRENRATKGAGKPEDRRFCSASDVLECLVRERFMCIQRHRDISAGAVEVFGVGCGSKSGTSFPRKLAAGFPGTYVHRGVVTTLRKGPRRNKVAAAVLHSTLEAAVAATEGFRGRLEAYGSSPSQASRCGP